MNQRQKTALGAAVVLALLAVSFFWGGRPPRSAPQTQAQPAQSAQDGANDLPPSQPEDFAPAVSQTPKTPPQGVAPGETAQPEQATQPPVQKPEAPPAPPPTQEPEGDPAPPQGPMCAFSIRCDTILDHMDWLDEDKVELVPKDGILLPELQVSFETGESAYDLLQRVTRQEKIHMEASITPGVGAAYVEGIGNLYEFDCGAQSGWLYLVNGVFPGYSCSEYALADGDKVEFVFTCDLGRDVGEPE